MNVPGVLLSDCTFDCESCSDSPCESCCECIDSVWSLVVSLDWYVVSMGSGCDLGDGAVVGAVTWLICNSGLDTVTVV